MYQRIFNNLYSANKITLCQNALAFPGNQTYLVHFKCNKNKKYVYSKMFNAHIISPLGI